jgi:hypothetical protein
MCATRESRLDLSHLTDILSDHVLVVIDGFPKALTSKQDLTTLAEYDI